jgi:hypothetical protein
MRAPTSELIACAGGRRAGPALPTAIAGSLSSYRWFPSILKVLTIIRPETLVRWHRRISHRLALEISPTEATAIDTDLHALIRRMSMEESALGDCHVSAGELLKLGFERSRNRGVTQSHGQATSASKSGMAHLSAQPPRRILPAMDLFRCSNYWLRLVLCLVIVVWAAETWSGSMSQQTRRLNGSHAS